MKQPNHKPEGNSAHASQYTGTSAEWEVSFQSHAALHQTPRVCVKYTRGVVIHNSFQGPERWPEKQVTAHGMSVRSMRISLLPL